MTVLRKMRTDEVALRKARMLVGGKWVDSASGKVLEVEDPAHRRPIAEVPRGGAEDVARAVQAAADATFFVTAVGMTWALTEALVHLNPTSLDRVCRAQSPACRVRR